MVNVPSWLPRVDYPPPGKGYWGPVTSTLNWCEEDYYATIYSAEIVNTLTNLLFMSLAVRGIVNSIKHGHDTVFLVTFIGFLIVGMGSFMFHSSLKYPMQLVDELSMIYTTCLMCFATFSYGKPKGYSTVLAIALISLAVFITGYYHYLQDPAFHQNAYAILTAIVLLRAIFVMESNLRPPKNRKKGEQVSKAEQDRRDIRDREILRRMWLMIAYGLTIFLGGFGLWTLDNVYCSTILRWRREIGLPWGVLLEGHGWWHIMTGVGAYFYITWGLWLRHCLNGRQDEYEMHWPRLMTSVPIVVRRPGWNGSTGHKGKQRTANGTAKKNT